MSAFQSGGRPDGPPACPAAIRSDSARSIRAVAGFCAYVTLAEAFGAPLITCDRLLASPGGEQAEIELHDRGTL